MKTDKGDVPVPINHAYNHHYVAWLKSEQAELKYVDADPHAAGHGYGHGSNKYWTAVPVPEEISKRFAGKTMAITGYEVDQVMKTDKGDVPVPINHAYNHHYVAWLKSEQAEL